MGCLIAILLLAGCANGDFGRVKPSLVTDNIHSWVGTEAPGRQGKPPSQFPLTDAERQLRDYAYPLIEPPYERQRWNSILSEYGINGGEPPLYLDRKAYAEKMLSTPVRSQNAHYTRLIDDIRNDVVRIDPFFSVAGYVVSMDHNRERALRQFPASNSNAKDDARARIAENLAVIRWVQKSLHIRASSYQHALERLVVVAPSPMAAEAERSLMFLQKRIAAYQGSLQEKVAKVDVPDSSTNISPYSK